LAFNLSNQALSGLMAISPILLLDFHVEKASMLANLGVALFASGVTYLVSTYLLAVVIGLDTGYPVRYLWTERFRWLAPYYLALGVVSFALLHSYLQAGLAGVFVLLVPLLMLRFSQVQYVEHTKSLVQELRKKNENLENYAEEIATLNEELLLALSQVIEIRDPYVLGHSQRVAHYAVEIAEEMGLSPERVELVRKASLLHDIGKLGVRESILLKPGRLTPQEFELVKQHTHLGSTVVDNCHSLRKLVPIIHHHHERYDGRGYPDRLGGKNIPVEARILSLADAVEAMASDRPYRKALGSQEIIAEVRQNAGGQFDPVVVKAFLDIVHRKGTIAFVKDPPRMDGKMAESVDSVPFPDQAPSSRHVDTKPGTLGSTPPAADPSISL
jgi:putative nucleotidyltransferase with HDIG domain